MQAKNKLKRHSRNWQLNTIQIKTRMIKRKQKKSSKRLRMRMKFYQTQKNVEYMINKEKKVFVIMMHDNNSKVVEDNLTLIWTWILMIFLANSLVATVDPVKVVVDLIFNLILEVELAVVININNSLKKKKNQKIFLRKQMFFYLTLVQFHNFTEGKKSGFCTSSIQN